MPTRGSFPTTALLRARTTHHCVFSPNSTTSTLLVRSCRLPCHSMSFCCAILQSTQAPWLVLIILATMYCNEAVGTVAFGHTTMHTSLDEPFQRLLESPYRPLLTCWAAHPSSRLLASRILPQSSCCNLFSTILLGAMSLGDLSSDY